MYIFGTETNDTTITRTIPMPSSVFKNKMKKIANNILKKKKKSKNTNKMFSANQNKMFDHEYCYDDDDIDASNHTSDSSFSSLSSTTSECIDDEDAFYQRCQNLLGHRDGRRTYNFSHVKFG